MLARSLSVKVALLSGAALALVFVIGMIVLVGRVSQTIQTETRELQTATTQGIADEIAASMAGASRAAHDIVAALEALHSAGPVDRAAYGAVLRRFLERDPQLLGTWAGWEPGAMDDQDAAYVDQPGYDATGRFIPYWNRAAGAIAVEPLRGYDSAEDGAYYQLPKTLDRAVAIEPYAYTMNGKDVLMMTFGVPIKDGAKFLGTGGVDLSLVEVNARLAELTPFGTGHVSVLTAAGLVVADRDPAAIGKPLADIDGPMAHLLAATLAEGSGEVDAPDADGVMTRSIATPIDVGGTQDRWVVISHVPVSTLEATVNEARWTIAGLATLCVLVACAILFGLIRYMVGRPLRLMGETVKTMAAGDYEVEVAATDRTDEIGTLARALEVFRENGIRMGEMTEEEKRASVRRRQERSDMMVALQAAFGEVVDAAVNGDFSKRVQAEFPDPELNALAASVNQLVETVDGGLTETGKVLAALANTDLSKRMQGDYAGAFAKLRADTNAVGDKLTQVMTRLRATSRALKTATGEILSGANDLSERTTKQAATIEETSAAIEQLASTVADNAQMAEDANGKVQVMSENARQSGEVMNQANAAMEEITSSSARISNIIGMIDDIAFQTNLLALNASVEAARAGDAGKGFAVVAVEVRRLAQSAASASADVKALIEQSSNEVESGSKLVSSAAEQLAHMLEAVEQNSALMQSIARASREQAAAIDEVAVAVRAMDEMTQHNAALVEQTNAAIEQTEAQASELDEVVDIFTLADEAAAPVRTAGPGRQERVRQAARSYLSHGSAALAVD